MKKNLGLSVVAALLSITLLAPRAYSHCGSCGVGEEKAAKGAAAKPHDCKDGLCKHHKVGCPAKVEGAQVSVSNTEDGVSITIKGKDAEAVKKIQEAGAKMASGDCCGKHGEHGGHEHKADKTKTG